jgi:hypothetical protein
MHDGRTPNFSKLRPSPSIFGLFFAEANIGKENSGGRKVPTDKVECTIQNVVGNAK